MKRIVLCGILAGISVAQAAFQYQVSVLDTYYGPGVSGSSYAVRISEGSGKLYLLDHINNLYSANQTESISRNVSAFGYINLTTGESGSGNFNNTITTYERAMNQWNDVVTQTGYELGTFSAGDVVAIWLTDKSTGYTGATAGQPDSAYVDNQLVWRSWGSQADILGNTAGQLSFSGGRSIFFGITGMESNGGPVTGQPLPGIFATLGMSGLIGGLAVWLKKRKSGAPAIPA